MSSSWGTSSKAEEDGTDVSCALHLFRAPASHACLYEALNDLLVKLRSCLECSEDAQLYYIIFFRLLIWRMNSTEMKKNNWSNLACMNINIKKGSFQPYVSLHAKHTLRDWNFSQQNHRPHLLLLLAQLFDVFTLSIEEAHSETFITGNTGRFSLTFNITTGMACQQNVITHWKQMKKKKTQYKSYYNQSINK